MQQSCASFLCCLRLFLCTLFMLGYRLFHMKTVQFPPSQSPARSMPYGLQEKQEIGISFHLVHGAFRLLRAPCPVPCCLTAGAAGKSREAVWARLWESIKGRRRGVQPARPAVSDCTHPVPPGGPWLQDALLPVQQNSCGSSYDTLVRPSVHLACGLCLAWELALRGSCL